MRLTASWRGNRLAQMSGSNMGFSHSEHCCYGGIKGCGMLDAELCESADMPKVGATNREEAEEGQCAADGVQEQVLTHRCVLAVTLNQKVDTGYPDSVLDEMLFIPHGRLCGALKLGECLGQDAHRPPIPELCGSLGQRQGCFTATPSATCRAASSLLAANLAFP